MAAQNAAQVIRQRLVDYACESYSVTPDQIRFHDGEVHVGTNRIAFRDLVAAAYVARISLSSTGFYRTPKIHWNRKTIAFLWHP